MCIVYIKDIYIISQVRFNMQILISNQSKEPIYRQIYTQIRKHILTDELNPGEALPSMRQLAKDLDISIITRSEEHTSELQSRFDIVCRLLLEKKKKNK